MKAEYFPPRKDVILQNEAPTDFYVLVSGAVVSIFFDVFTGLLCSFFLNVRLQSENWKNVW